MRDEEFSSSEEEVGMSNDKLINVDQEGDLRSFVDQDLSSPFRPNRFSRGGSRGTASVSTRDSFR